MLKFGEIPLEFDGPDYLVQGFLAVGVLIKLVKEILIKLKTFSDLCCHLAVNNKLLLG